MKNTDSIYFTDDPATGFKYLERFISESRNIEDIRRVADVLLGYVSFDDLNKIAEEHRQLRT